MRILPQNRVLRALAWLGIALVSLEVLYLVVGNIALAACAKRFDTNSPVGLSFEHGFTWLPGRAYLRGVKAHGGGTDPWAVAIDGATIAFAPWSVVTSPRRIDSVSMDASQVDIGARRSKGKMHVVATDVTIDDALLSFKVDAKVDDATLESSGVVLAKSMKGTITLDIAPVDVDKRSILETASGKVALDGVFLSLEPLASFGSLATVQDPGTLHVAGTLDKGQLAPSSEIHAHTGRATLKDDHGAKGDFPKGIDVVVRVAPARPSELQLAIETPSLVFGGADPTKPADTFDDFEMTVPAGQSDLKTNKLEMRSLDWTSPRATIHEGETTLTAKASGHFHFTVRSDGALVADGGYIQAASVVVENPDTPDRTPFDARLVIERLAVTHESGIAMRGPLHASGSDARPLLEILVTNPSIRQNVSGALAHKAFTLDTTLTRDDTRVTLDDLALVATGLKLRGTYRRNDKTTRGAFILDDGVLPPVGIALHDKTESFTIGASQAWLTKQLE
jgi:hypothetical protein